MINCVVYNESCCVCLWIPLLCRSDTPGAEKHLAMMNLLSFIVALSQKGEQWFCLQVSSRKRIKASEKIDMVGWERKHLCNIKASCCNTSGSASPFMNLLGMNEEQNTFRKSDLQANVFPPTDSTDLTFCIRNFHMMCFWWLHLCLPWCLSDRFLLFDGWLGIIALKIFQVKWHRFLETYLSLH